MHAVGRLSGEPTHPAEAEPDARTVEVAVRLLLLPEPVSRSAVRAEPALAQAEVLRMPAGSNPSYLTREAVDRLAGLLPPGASDPTAW